MKIHYKNWLLTSYIGSLLYIGSAYHYLNVLRYNFLLAIILVLIIMFTLGLLLHFQNQKILFVTALVITLFYIAINMILLFN